MSQAKVDRYKAEKKNRDELNKKAKRSRRLGLGIFIAVCAVFIGWFGFSVYQSATRPSAEEEGALTEWDVNAYNEYRSGLKTTYSSEDYPE